MGGNKKGGKSNGGGGGGGGKGKKKKKEQEEKDVLTEVDREYYEVQLVDLNRKLARLRTRAHELEVSNSDLEENLKQLDEDRADIIAYLKKTLMVKTDEMTELQERLDGLKQSMESGVVKYKEKISQMEQEYRNMKEELTSEIKLLMGKLNSLEEFRTQKDELMAKYAAQEEAMAEQDRSHKQSLYECERNFILEKNKLKKQVETKLLDLSNEFQDATDMRIAATTQRMIRENIAINNELDRMQAMQKEMVQELQTVKQQKRTGELKIELLEDEIKLLTEKNCNQVKVIERLVKEHKSGAEKLEMMKETEEKCRKLEEELEQAEDELHSSKAEISILSKRLSDGQSHAAMLYADVAALKLNSKRLYVILHKAVNSVKGAMLIKTDAGLDDAMKVTKRDDLLNNLLHLLNRAEMSEKERSLLGVGEEALQTYETGHLGFIPKTDAKQTV